MKLSYYINFILNLENVSILSEQQAFDIDGFDTAVLMLDDIQDQSKVRDGKPCFYVIHGVEKTKEEARVLQKKSFETLSTICSEGKIGLIGKIRARFLLNRLHSAVIRGQKIDTFLEYSEKVNYSFIKKYDEMLGLFTGGHIGYGFLLGYLFSKKNPSYKNKVVSIGKKIGLIRQIVDDLNDYKKEQHEPLGDLVNHKKRLPELIFLLNSTDEEKAKLNNLLRNPDENISEITILVLNEKVNKLIEQKIINIKEDILFEMKKLPKTYQENLEGLLKKFYK